MAPHVSESRVTLTFPLYCAEFDPQRREYLVVGGGGGAGRSGIPNKISLLDVSSRNSIEEVGDIDLSRDEDSVSSLGTVATKDGVVAYAGINSSEAQQKAGKNEHLRVFEAAYPARKKRRTAEEEKVEEKEGEAKVEDVTDTTTDITLISKSALFQPTKQANPETYQRVLRLSPANPGGKVPNERVGAVCTGLAATQGEIVLFPTNKPTLTTDDIIKRISLGKEEATDIDIYETEPNHYVAAYVTDSCVWIYRFNYDYQTGRAQEKSREPHNVYEPPIPDSFTMPGRPKFRALRFLTKDYLLLLANMPGRKGAELRLFRLVGDSAGEFVLRKMMPSSVKAAVGLDAVTLNPDPKTGDRQIVCAVASHDLSIHILTLEYNARNKSLSGFRPFTILKNVHEQQITRLAFEPYFLPPAETALNERGVSYKRAHGPQYLRLASVSMANTVVVQTMALTPATPVQPESRYVLNRLPGGWSANVAPLSVVGVFVLIIAALIQGVMELRGESRHTGISDFLPEFVRDFVVADLRVPRSVNSLSDLKGHVGGKASEVVESMVPSSVPGQRLLQRIMDEHKPSHLPENQKAIVIHAGEEGEELNVQVHPDHEEYVGTEHGKKARRWEEMPPHEQSQWKKRLSKAGHWVEGQGETILKSCLFSEYAGLVGEAVAGAMGS